jgi:PTS system mannose-specific IIA component
MLVVTHGRLAEDLVEAVQTIVGPVERLAAVSIGWNDDVEAATGSIEEAIGRVDRGQGTLVLTDMFGGTPTNLSLSLHDPGKIEIVTGVNLPMLIKFANLRKEMSLQEAAAEIAEQGRQAIHVASDVLDMAHRVPGRESGRE